MSEEINIPEENNKEQIPISKEDEISENILSPEDIEQTETQIEKSDIITSDVPNMEVHHHPNVEKKNFKEYLLEGLMIFIAVTMGFFAENIRENISENKIGGELAKSFYEELKADSVIMNMAINNRDRRDSALNYLKSFYSDSSISSCSKTFAINFFYVYETFNVSVFEPNDAILQQLKNSGSLRYFKSLELQKLTDNLSVRINYIRTRNQIEWTYYNEHLIPFLQSHNDQAVLNLFQKDSKIWVLDAMRKYETNNEPIVFHFQKPETFDKVEAVNSIGFYQIITRSNARKAYQDYISINHQLLEVLRKEYHLENE